MKQIVVLVLMAGALFAEWENAYGYGSSIAKPNQKMDYNREFHKSIDEGSIYDESMKNPMSPMMVEEEDRMMKPSSREKNNYKKNTGNFFYSTNKRDYYREDAKPYKKFPTTDF